MPFRTKIRFEAATVQSTRRLFGVFPNFTERDARRVFEKHFLPYREEMRQRSKYGPLFKNTGRLSGSFDREITGGGLLSQLRASVFSRSSYSVIHERGGVVYPPRGSSWIFIPTVYNAIYTRRAHIRRAKKTVREVIAAGGRFMSAKDFVREYPDARKTLTIMDYVTRSLVVDATGIPMFTQVKRATYKAQLGFFETGAKYEQRMIADLAEGEISYWRQ